MTYDRWIPYITCGLGLGLGALTSLMWRAPDVTIAACPKGLSGFWICTQEWQTAFAGVLALVGGLAVYFAARHQSDAASKAKDQELRRQQRAVAVILVADFKHVRRVASASVINIQRSIAEDEMIGLERLDSMMPSPIELDAELRTRVAYIEPNLASDALQAIAVAQEPRKSFARSAVQYGPNAEIPARNLQLTLEMLQLIVSTTSTIIDGLIKYEAELRD